LLGLFSEMGKKERKTIVRREAILHHRLMPPARAQSLVGGGDPLKLVWLCPRWATELLLDCGRAATKQSDSLNTCLG
jgi:hypothetical protein